MRPRKAGNLNIWKWLFLAQLALLIGCGIVLYTRIQTDRDLTKLVQTSTEDTKVGTFSLIGNSSAKPSLTI